MGREDPDGVTRTGGGVHPPTTGSAVARARWEHWVTGVRPPPVGPPGTDGSAGRVLVFQDAEWLGVAARSGWIGAGDTVLDPTPTGSPGWIDVPYGLAGWTIPPAAGTGPGVVLRIGDDHDLSAFLREADRAMTTGHFAEHLLRPDVLVGDLSSLGADTAAAGPDHRLWVAADGRVSTSRSGADLGRVDESPAVVAARWRNHNDGGSRPCAVGLAKSLDERERSEVLADRPWLPRYHAGVRAMRGLRARGWCPVAASGFGCRLDRRIAAAQPGPVVDDPGAPLLLVTRTQGRDRHWAVDPGSARAHAVDAADAARLEYLLAFRTRSGAGLVDLAFGAGGRSPAGALDDLVDRLVGEDIGARWFTTLECGSRPLAPGHTVFD